MRRIADNDDIAPVDPRRPACDRASNRDLEQRVALLDIVAEGPAAKIAPEVEVLELDAGAALEVTGEQCQVGILSHRESLEQRTNAWQDPFARPRVVDLAREMFQVGIVESPQAL